MATESVRNQYNLQIFYSYQSELGNFNNCDLNDFDRARTEEKTVQLPNVESSCAGACATGDGSFDLIAVSSEFKDRHFRRVAIVGRLGGSASQH